MKNAYDLVVADGLIITGAGTIAGDIGIAGGKIREIAAPGTLAGNETIDAGGCYVLPGGIDPHTHPVYLDNLADLSRTGAWGGVTTTIHYAYAKPGQSLVEILKEYIAAGTSGSHTDFALHGGLFETRKQAEEIPAAFGMGVTSFKMFMAYAKLGWMTDDYALVKACDIIGRNHGLAAVHAENGMAIDYIQDKLLAENADMAKHFLETSPDLAEAEAIFRAAYLGRLMRCPVYIPHISSREGIEVIRFLKGRGMLVFAETCPQYLGLTWDELSKRGPLGKVGPAVKTKEDQESLWQAVRGGLFDTIGSDHAPKGKKVDEDFFKAAYGSPEIETMLPVLWQLGVNGGRITPNDLVRLFSENPARIFGLFPAKGNLAPGSDADIVVFDPHRRWTVRAAEQHTNADYSLFEGMEMLGKVRTVIAGGDIVVDSGEFRPRAGKGNFLKTRAGQWIPPYLQRRMPPLPPGAHGPTAASGGSPAGLGGGSAIPSGPGVPSGQFPPPPPGAAPRTLR
jgi:dihydropyrimidinase